jgi:site-specific recombinase XerD
LIGEPRTKEENTVAIGDNSPTAVNKNLKNWLAMAELDKKITFYFARHSFACLY